MTTKSVMISFLAAIILNIKMEITRNSVLSLILDLVGWWVQDLLQPFTSITGISPPLSRQCIAVITWFPWLPRQQNIMVYVKHRAVREDEISVKKNESVTILSSNLSRGYLVHRPSTAQVLFQTHKINIYWITLLLYRVRRLRAGCHPIVFISLGQRPGNLQPGHSGFLPLFLWRASA